MELVPGFIKIKLKIFGSPKRTRKITVSFTFLCVSKFEFFNVCLDVSNRIDVFAVVLKYPYETNSVDIKYLASFADENTKVSLLGFDGPIQVFLIEIS